MALQDTIDYVTISTTGNATDFGDLLSPIQRLTGTSDATRGVVGGGLASTNVIQYITIASTGNATDFGDLLGTGYHNFSATSNSLRGVFTGGRSGTENVLQYITIQSLGNSIDFGDLTYSAYNVGSTSNGTGGLN